MKKYCLWVLLFVLSSILWISQPVSAATVSVRFGYGTASHTAEEFLSYEVITPWLDGYYTGNYPSLPISGLKPDTTYYYRVQIKSGEVINTSANEIIFTTAPEVVTTTKSFYDSPNFSGDKKSGDLDSPIMMGKSGATPEAGSPTSSTVGILEMGTFALVGLGALFVLRTGFNQGSIVFVILGFIMIVFLVVGVQIIQQAIDAL